MKRLIPIVECNHEEESDPGLVITNKKPDSSFYTRGVRTIMNREVIDEELSRIGATTFEIGCGRGLIGCTCGMAWEPGDSTFELLTYRPRERWGTKRIFDPSGIEYVENNILTTFNSYENRSNKVAMVPSTPCPVMYGLRGDNAEDLIEGFNKISTEELDRWMIFLTNQGSDDHIIHEYDEMIPNQSYYIEGTVVGNCNHIQGGHAFLNIQTKHGLITCAAYEPSKEFRYLFDWLVEGDTIGVMGELREDPLTFNVEKVKVIDLVEDVSKLSNPVCPECGNTMKSAGKNAGFRCKKCHTKAENPILEKNTRWVVEGWYEPPTSARRHLSKPLKRMGLEQPVDFVNCRN